MVGSIQLLPTRFTLTLIEKMPLVHDVYSVHLCNGATLCLGTGAADLSSGISRLDTTCNSNLWGFSGTDFRFLAADTTKFFHPCYIKNEVSTDCAYPKFRYVPRSPISIQNIMNHDIIQLKRSQLSEAIVILSHAFNDDPLFSYFLPKQTG